MGASRSYEVGRRGGATLALGLVVAACGGPEGHTRPVGTSTSAAVAQDGQPLDFRVHTTDGGDLFVGELRGEPALLFLFATFDGVSQAALRPLGRFARDHPDVQVLGIAVQPYAGPLVAAWAHALQPPFPLGHDPDERVAEGTSALGAIDRIPTFVMLDARGRVVERHVGFASVRDLERMLRRVRRPRPGRGSER